ALQQDLIHYPVHHTHAYMVGMATNPFPTSWQTQEGASICTNQELDYEHPHYLGIEEVALDGVELELGPRAPKATKVDYLSSPYNASWPPAQADFESSRVRKTKQFRDVLETCKQKVEAMEALEHSPPVSGGGFEEQAGEAVVAVGDVGGGGGGSGADGMRLVQLLVACAEAVACRDRAQAAALLRELQVGAPVHGTAFQRVASCFVQGLADRLALAHPPALGPASMAFSVPRSSCLDGARGEALAVAYELCPYLRFAHFVANASILEAFDGESNVHVVDLGMTMGLNRGHQWR
uniref:Uncharacterized protein n=1 Tax=Aegilops tauschii subsp. strangulata TaxID=200361 RepID=A0A453G3M8_AEGTS